MKKDLHHHVSQAKKKLSKPDYLRILTLRTIGNFLVLLSLFLIVKTFYQPVREEVRFFVESRLGKKYVLTEDLDNVPKGQLANFLKGQNIEVLVPKDPQFSIVVPKIGANAKIVQNVNPAREQEYLAELKKGVAHTLGTSFPGENGHIFLFAHSTDYFWNVGTYNAVFYLLYKLQTGDEVNLFYEGKRYVYQVEGTKVVNPDQVEYLTRKTDSEFLTLQTCWPPGTTLKRLLVFARRVAE